jgi:GxxExxY protein
MDQVRQTAYEIHLYLGHGHLEKVYENALTHRLRKVGMEVTTTLNFSTNSVAPFALYAVDPS